VDASVSLEVRNTGTGTGTENYVGQLLGQPASPTRARRLRARVNLEPGKKAKVDVQLDTRSLQYWDARQNAWVTPRGTLPIYVGANAADVRIAGSLTLR